MVKEKPKEKESVEELVETILPPGFSIRFKKSSQSGGKFGYDIIGRTKGVSKKDGQRMVETVLELAAFVEDVLETREWKKQESK